MPVHHPDMHMCGRVIESMPAIRVDLALLVADGLGVGEDAAALLVPVSLQALVPHAQLLTWQPQIHFYAIGSADHFNAVRFVNSLASTFN